MPGLVEGREDGGSARVGPTQLQTTAGRAYTAGLRALTSLPEAMATTARNLSANAQHLRGAPRQAAAQRNVRALAAHVPSARPSTPAGPAVIVASREPQPYLALSLKRSGLCPRYINRDEELSTSTRRLLLESERYSRADLSTNKVARTLPVPGLARGRSQDPRPRPRSLPQRLHRSATADELLARVLNRAHTGSAHCYPRSGHPAPGAALHRKHTDVTRLELESHFQC